MSTTTVKNNPSTSLIDHPVVKIGARSLLGLIFLVFGLNGFLQFLPMPPLPEQAGQFLGGLASSGYFFPLLKSIEVIVGVMLLANIFTPLALTILAPITVNIVLFHALLAPAGVGLPIVILALHLLLAVTYRDYYKQVLTFRA